MASKVDSPWDVEVSRMLTSYELPLHISNTMHGDIVSLMGKAYSRGREAGAKSEREYPHREDMGR